MLIEDIHAHNADFITREKEKHLHQEHLKVNEMRTDKRLSCEPKYVKNNNEEE